MAALETLAFGSSPERILEVMERDGACILADVIAQDKVEETMSEVMPWVERTSFGRDTFTGKQTRRTGALVARSPACRDLVMNPQVLAAASPFLLQFADRMQLHLTQTIYIGPGQGAQLLHRDRLAWGKFLPREIEPQFNTIWALTDFTQENGATRVVPGSHRWEWKREPEDSEICQAAMSKGSVLLYTGSVIHSGGENKTDESRMGLNITYCLGWLRQEENQYLSCPPEVARDLPIALQEMLGYTQGNYALGYFSDPDGLIKDEGGILPPERAVGSRPRTDIDIFNPPE
jgi:ectoine hydroxylase-related dioxygenase (phytanoyl-CoA dioxygenase family)